MSILMAMQAAMQHYKEDRLPQAEALCRQILQESPSSPDALHLLGLIAHQVSKNEIAVELIGRALALKPDFTEGPFNLGNVL